LLGIIFTGGEGPHPQIAKRIIKKETRDVFFVAADSGLAAAEEAGIKPHCIIGDMDSIDASRLKPYPAECVIRHERDKDYTDTELALQKITENRCDEIWIFGGGEGRIDHLLAIRSLFERDLFPGRWLTKTEDIRCIDAETEKNELVLYPPIGTKVSVFPLGSGPWETKSSGLKWQLSGLSWDRMFFSLSNVTLDSELKIKAEKGRFFVILPHFNN
jgi:thiamine pyrophosphokinase